MTTSKWNVTLRGHNAIVSITPNVPAGTFAGEITSSEYGRVQITNAKIEDGQYTGNVRLNGTDARIEASVGNAGNLNGTVHVGWFISVDFTGSPLKT